MGAHLRAASHLLRAAMECVRRPALRRLPAASAGQLVMAPSRQRPSVFMSERAMMISISLVVSSHSAPSGHEAAGRSASGLVRRPASKCFFRLTFCLALLRAAAGQCGSRSCFQNKTLQTRAHCKQLAQVTQADSLARSPINSKFQLAHSLCLLFHRARFQSRRTTRFESLSES